MFESLVTSMPLSVCGILSLQLMMNLSLGRRFDTAQAWLLAWAVTAALLYGCHFVYFHRLLAAIPFTDTLYCLCNLMVYPLFLVYVSQLTERNPLSRRPRLLLSALGVILLPIIAIGTLYIYMPSTETAHFIDNYLYRNDASSLSGMALWQAWLHNFCKVAFAAEVIGVVLLSSRKIRSYNQLVEQLYADTDDKTLHTLHTLLWLIIVCSALSFVANALGRYYFTSSLWLLSVPSVLFSVVLFGIGWAGLNQQFSICDIKPEESGVQKESAASDTLMELHQRLLRVMDEQQPFLQPDLKLDDLALMLHTNRTYLLRVMRQELHMSFSEYINRRRIAYACQLMNEHPELNKQDIAQRSGYLSSSSFYRNFKAYAPA